MIIVINDNPKLEWELTLYQYSLNFDDLQYSRIINERAAKDLEIIDV